MTQSENQKKLEALFGVKNDPAATNTTQPPSSPNPTQHPVQPTPMPVPPSRPKFSVQWVLVAMGVVLVVAVAGLIAMSVSDRTTSTPDDISLGRGSSDLFTQPRDIPSLTKGVIPSTLLVTCSPANEPDMVYTGTAFALDVSPLSGTAGETVLVTNNHVIEGCEQSGLQVSLLEGDTPASVVATDPKRDLAVLSYGGNKLAPLAIGGEPQLGQWVMAVGNPIEDRDSVSFGQVSNTSTVDGLISSSAVLGPGNSGGPLVDANGQVIGINAAVYEDARGISLSIPVNQLCLRVLQCKN